MKTKHSDAPSIIPKKMIVPFLLVSSLFALWGLANAVTDPMVQAFKKVLELSNSQAAWVQMAFYGGYFCMALPAALFVRKYSYKAGIIIGLALYAGGALLFYPATQTEQFWFFCLGLYVITFGLAFLETTASPYILAMGDRSTGTQRLNFAQAFNPLGLLLGLYIAQQFVLEKLQSDDIATFSQLSEVKKIMIRSADLMVIRDPYIILGLVVLVMLVLIAVVKMPKAKDAGARAPLQKTFNYLITQKKYSLGVLAQVFYVGAQIMCWTYIYQYAEAKGITGANAANYQFLAFILFLLGRILGTYLLKNTSAGKLLRNFAVLGGVFSIGTIFIMHDYGLYSLISISFFMSIMFPTIYGEALDGLSEAETKIGAAGLVMAIVGGALMPKLQGMIIDFGGNGVTDIQLLGVPEVNFSFVLPLISFVYIAFYGNFLMLEKKS